MFSSYMSSFRKKLAHSPARRSRQGPLGHLPLFQRRLLPQLLRATDHMVCSYYLLTTKSHVIDRTVRLPNGANATITHIDSVHFANFILHDVLCVPFFKLNLMSISKFAQNSHYLVIFTNNTCILQDQRLGKMIGMGTE